MGKQFLLKEDFVQDLYEMIHENSIKRQTEVMNKHTAENAE